MIRAVLDGLDDRREWEMKLALSGAWWSAMLPRMKEPPSLADLLGEEAPASTDDDAERALAMWERVTVSR